MSTRKKFEKIWHQGLQESIWDGWLNVELETDTKSLEVAAAKAEAIVEVGEATVKDGWLLLGMLECTKNW